MIGAVGNIKDVNFVARFVTENTLEISCGEHAKRDDVWDVAVQLFKSKHYPSVDFQIRLTDSLYIYDKGEGKFYYSFEVKK